MQGGSFVVDTSVAVKWLSQTNELYLEQAFDIAKLALQEKITLYAPDLLVHEMGNVFALKKKLQAEELRQTIEKIFELPLALVKTTEDIATTAGVIAQLQSITFYDALYLALTYSLSATLISANPKHHKPLPTIPVIRIDEWKVS